MSDKPPDLLNSLDRAIRKACACGMEDGVVMTIEFISGFELFNTRPYHNYETWSQGYRVKGRGVTIEREDLDDAIRDWANEVRFKQAVQPMVDQLNADIERRCIEELTKKPL